jgi:phosphoglycerate dehydrogenase-like enzyme
MLSNTTLPPVVFIAVPGAPLPAALDALRAITNVVVVENAQSFRLAQGEAEVALVWDFQTDLLREVGARGLNWIHARSSGVDGLITPEIAQAPVVVTNTRGVYERPMAEYVLAALLFFAKDLRRTVRDQRARKWMQRPTEAIGARRALVLGAGPVGREITMMLRAVGMTVDVVGRRARGDETELGRVHAVDELDSLLARADDVILALPLTAQTEHILDSQRLGRTRPGIRIVNVGRGRLIDEHALLDALQSGHVGAAALDVFEHEPLRADHPFWAMDNVLVSPHLSGDALGWERAVIELFVDNLDRWSRGAELRNVVDKEAFAIAAARR